MGMIDSKLNGKERGPLQKTELPIPKGEMIMHNRTSSGGLTAICAFVVGLAFCVIGLTHFLMPRENLLMASGVDRAFFESLASNPIPFAIHYWAFIWASLFGIGVVLGLHKVFRLENSALLTLASAWGIVGLSISAINFGFLQSQALATAVRFADLDPAAQTAILSVGFKNLDPYSLMGFGLVGAWSLTVNVLSLRRRLFPKALALIGCSGALLYEMVFLGTTFHLEVLIDIAAAGALVVGPVWFIWLGLVLKKGQGRAVATV
jgi:hypothetical protein